MLGLMVSLTIMIDFGLTKTLHGWELAVFLPLIILGTMVITGLINVAVDRIAYRPLRRAPRLVPLISAIGVSFMLENLTLVIKGPYVLSYPDVFPSIDIVQDVLHLDSAVYITTKDLLVIGVTIPLIFALHLFITRTYWGKAMRAAAQDRETAEAMGIDVERVIMLTFCRRRARGRRGRGPGPLLQHRPVVDGLPGGPQGVHRRRAGRDRQHAGSGARWIRDRHPLRLE